MTAGNKEWGRKVPDSVTCPACVGCVESREVAEAAELVQKVRGTHLMDMEVSWEPLSLLVPSIP